jgi:hypothetical protein
MPAYELYDLVKGFEKTYYKDMYDDIDETRGSIGVPLSSGLVVSIFPHRPLKIKKPSKGKLNYNEAFNNPYPIDWGGTDDPEGDRWVGTSKLEDGSLLTLEIASFDPGQFQIDFYRKDKTNVDTMKATGQGDEFRVFATVQKGILEWWESIDQDEVSRIEFAASKEADDSKNRYKLYARFAKQWANKIGWTATTGEKDGGVNFVLMRPNAAKFAKDQGLEVMEDVDVSTQRGRLEYFLKQPSISQGRAIHLGKLPKYHDGEDELTKLVPERNGVYALHPDAWERTFYSLTNKDLKKITRYQPAIVKIPQGSIVADMAIANQFYRTNDPEEKEKFAKAYKDSIVPYGSDTSHMKMPEIIMPRLIESKMKGGSDFYKFMGYKLKDLDPDNIRQLPKVLRIDPAVAKPKIKPKVDPEDFEEQIDEDLRDWFKQKWVNIGKKKKGGGHPECGTSGDKRGYAKCVPAAKAAKMSKKEKESAVRRKRAAQNKKGRGGKKKAGSGKKPIRVSTKAKK